MKKNFFKKLSFVLALAMIVSVLAPAAGAFAATAPKLSATTKYLYLGDDTKGEYDFNISNKVTGWKYLWSSANDDVATVNTKNGLTTATGAGSTKISVVITDKNGEEKAELTATVVVRDNIKEITISNAAAGEKLAVGKTFDFNRSYVTVAGKKTGSQAKTAWTVTDKDGKATTNATIDANGNFVAKVAGEYVVEARAFQSSAKMTAWVSDPVKYASYVTSNVASAKVTVAASMVKAEQVDIDTLKVTFDSAVSDAATKLSVFNVIGNTEVASSVKKVTMNADNTATVDMYVPFTEKSTVVVKYPTMVDVKFVAATTNVADVTKLEVVTTTAEIGTPKTLEVKFLNADGVNIADADLYNRLTWASSNLSAPVSGGKVTMYKVGDTTTLTATFHTYNYDTTTGTETGNLTQTGVVTCVDKAVANTGNLNVYTILTAGTPSYTDAKHSVAVGDTKTLYVQLKGTNPDGTELLTSSHNTTAADWEFTSSDINVLNVDRTSGAIYPYKAGSAIVIVKYKTVIVGTCAITVTAAREVATVTLSANTFSLSRDNDVQDVKTVDIKVKDQLGDDYSSSRYTATVTLKSGNAGTVYVSNTNTSVLFNGCPAGASATELAEGTYTYEVKVKDNVTNKELTSYVNVSLLKPAADGNSASEVYYYAVETNKTSYDMKLVDTVDNNETATISVFGYATNGVKNVRVDANLVANNLTVKKADNTVVATTTSGVNANDALLDLVPVTTGSIIEKASKGIYTVSVSNGAINAVANFTVDDTQPTPVVTIDKYYTSVNTSLLDAVKDCISVKYDGTDISDNFTSPVTVGTAVTNSNNSITVFVKEVTYTKTITGLGTLVFTVPVNTTLTYNYQ